MGSLVVPSIMHWCPNPYSFFSWPSSFSGCCSGIVNISWLRCGSIARRMYVCIFYRYCGESDSTTLAHQVRYETQDIPSGGQKSSDILLGIGWWLHPLSSSDVTSISFPLMSTERLFGREQRLNIGRYVSGSWHLHGDRNLGNCSWFFIQN